VAYIFVYILCKVIHDAQSFLGYVLLTNWPNFSLFSHSILFSITCTSATGGIMV